MKRMKRKDFNVSNDGNGHYAVIRGTDEYLFKPGIVMAWLKMDQGYRDNRVYFSSREKLERCLDKFLEEQKKLPVLNVPWVHFETKFSWNKNELLEEQKMNYFMLDGKRIPMSNETAKSLREEQTYKIGDCFKVGVEEDVVVKLCATEANIVLAMCIDAPYDGSRWTEPAEAENIHKITEKELHAILNTDTIIPVNIKIEEVA